MHSFNIFSSGLIALIASSMIAGGLSGCRLGNRVERNENPDTTSGYYETTFKNALYWSKKTTGTTEFRPTADQFIALNDPIITLMTPLVGAVLVEPGVVKLKSPWYSSYIVLAIDSFLKLQSLPEAAPPPSSGPKPTCYAETKPLLTGMLVKAATPYKVTVEQQAITTLGRLEFQYGETKTFVGNCAEDLFALYACYEDYKACPGNTDSERQDYSKLVWNTFRPYIDAGVLAKEEIPNVLEMGYEVTYE